MRIVYSAGNRLGAAHQVFGFLEHTSHDVRIAAFRRSGRLLHFTDWTLDAIKSDNNIERLQIDIQKYDPDLVVIDGEPVVATIARSLSIPIVYCSPLHILDGVPWERGQLAYSAQVEELRKTLTDLPIGVTRFVYSPFGDIDGMPSLRDGFEWVRPYHFSVDRTPQVESILFVIEDDSRFENLTKTTLGLRLNLEYSRELDFSYIENLKLAEWVFTTGETRHIADAIYSNKQICIFPNIKDPETIMNAILCSQFGVGFDAGQVELMGRFAQAEIEKILKS